MCGENCFKNLILNYLCVINFIILFMFYVFIYVYSFTVFCLCASQFCEYGPRAIDMLIDSETDQSICLQASLKQWAGRRRSTGTERRRTKKKLNALYHKPSDKSRVQRVKRCFLL